MIGCLLEVDLKYPNKLCELHNYYPIAREKLAVPSDMFSNYCKEIADKYEIKVGDVKKIIPNLGKSLEINLTKIHRVLKFKQSDWMKNISILTLKK